ncbi:cytochrome P450 302a1, mitochondrial [Anopheles nili]|uniref:cytochrome P450 302a1, mitochondrial n=1 Tax=Anopheles nili TaxID=185578 RepID=UPI00237C0A7B|nr:cytochrome P450 302a1, mitochondrial [Anopheles nili]
MSLFASRLLLVGAFLVTSSIAEDLVPGNVATPKEQATTVNSEGVVVTTHVENAVGDKLDFNGEHFFGRDQAQHDYNRQAHLKLEYVRNQDPQLHLTTVPPVPLPMPVEPEPDTPYPLPTFPAEPDPSVNLWNEPVQVLVGVVPEEPLYTLNEVFLVQSMEPYPVLKVKAGRYTAPTGVVNRGSLKFAHSYQDTGDGRLRNDVDSVVVPSEGQPGELTQIVVCTVDCHTLEEKVPAPKSSVMEIPSDGRLWTAKSFDDIPGPRGPFGLGNLYQYLPGIGRYSFDELHRSGEAKYQKYGPIVRETMVPGSDIVWLYDPEDVAAVLGDQTPGMYPSRRSHTALEKYRKDRPNVYRTAGLLPTNGLEWWKIRSELQKGLSSPQSVRNFLPATDKITKEFVARLKSKTGQHQDNTAESILIEDFMPDISRLNLELICLLAFDVRLDSFSEEQMHPNSMSSRLMESAETTNSCILPTDQGFQLWRFFETPAYRRLRKAQEFMEKTAVELVSQKLLYFDEDQQRLASDAHGSKSLMEEYLRNPNLELNDIIGMAADLLLAGVHTTSYTTAFALYYLALNRTTVQDRLFQEAKKILPDSRENRIGAAVLGSEASYCRAVLKESLRLNPISIGVGRILNRDHVLGGYCVPRGTVVVTQNMISCRQEAYFREPYSFRPERWMRETKEPVSPHLVLPFGHGMRSCIARRLAEQSMLVLLLRLVRSYEIEWAGNVPMDVKTKLINQPDQPIKLRLKPRPS